MPKAQLAEYTHTRALRPQLLMALAMRLFSRLALSPQTFLL